MLNKLASLSLAEALSICTIARARGVRIPMLKVGAAIAGREVTAPGVLRVGASAAWRMQPPAAQPKTTAPNSNPAARSKETPKLRPPSNRAFHKDLMESLHNPQRGFRITKPG